jgi:mono/diheme cytochrome c family protein
MSIQGALKMQTTNLKHLAVGMMAAAALLAFAGTAAAQDAKAVEKGAKVYAEQKCSMCHSIDGKGNAKGSLDGVGSKLNIEEIRQWIVEPAAMTAKTKAARKPPMPSKFSALPKGDLDALVGYLSSLKKK